ncbi:WD40-repeat-containing domain protein [Lentinula raphanica]|nr:WD40-repeat-containing domain protein [Lentinula raphanica]
MSSLQNTLQNMSNLRYKRYTTFKGLRNAVSSIAISADGKYLAAAGLFGAAVWSLITFESLALPTMRVERLCSTSAWLHFDNDCGTASRHVLVLGSLNGQVSALDVNEEEMELQAICLPVTRSTVQQVLSLDVQQPEVGNKSRARVVASFADFTVKCWTLGLNGDFQLVFSMNFEPGFLPKTVRFHEGSQHVLVFSRTGGIRALLDQSSGKIIARIANGCEIMTSVSVHQPTSRFVASTGYGFQLFNLSNLRYIRTFAHDTAVQNDIPCQVTFAENGSKVVGGTSQGEALLFDSHSGLLEQRMKCPRDELIQTVTTCTLKNKYYIAVAGSASGQASEIVVWCKLRTQSPAHKKKTDPVLFAVHRSTALFLVYVLVGVGVSVLLFTFFWGSDLEISPSVNYFLKFNLSLRKCVLTKMARTLQILTFFARILEKKLLNILGLQYVNGGH